MDVYFFTLFYQVLAMSRNWATARIGNGVILLLWIASDEHCLNWKRLFILHKGRTTLSKIQPPQHYVIPYFLFSFVHVISYRYLVTNGCCLNFYFLIVYMKQNDMSVSRQQFGHHRRLTSHIMSWFYPVPVWTFWIPIQISLIFASKQPVDDRSTRDQVRQKDILRTNVYQHLWCRRASLCRDNLNHEILYPPKSSHIMNYK